MSLQALSSTSTDFQPSIRFHARNGVFSPVDRSLNAQGILLDLTNIKLGQLKFEGGVDIQVQHHSLPDIPQPSDKHIDRLMLEIYLPKTIRNGSPLREFSHTTAGVKNAINDLHTAREKGAENVASVEREAGGSFVETPASPAGNDDLPF